MRWPLHVDYVTDVPEDAIDALEFFVALLSEPANAVLVGGGTLAVFVAMATWLRVQPTVPDFGVLAARLETYRELVPWMLRLAIGLPTLAAGFAGYYFSPVVVVPGTRLPLVIVGFLLLVGLATRTAAVFGLLLWAWGLTQSVNILLSMEYPFAFLAIVLVGSGRPSADDLFAAVSNSSQTFYSAIDPVRALAMAAREALDPYRPFAATVVRVGLGLTFVYLGLVEKLLNPARGLLVVAKYDLTAVVPVDPGLWVLGAGLTEIGLGLLLLAGLFTRASAAVAFVVLTTTLFGLPDDPVLAHVSLFGLSSAVFTLGSGPLSLDQWRSGRASTSSQSATPAD